MREDTVAERYARALLDIGVDKGTLENLGTELNRVRKLFADSEELHKVMSHPSGAGLWWRGGAYACAPARDEGERRLDAYACVPAHDGWS